MGEREQIGNKLICECERQTELSNICMLSSETQKILDSLPFYVLLVDDKHRIVLANKAVHLKLGKDTDSIIGGYCPNVIHGCDQPISVCPLEEAVQKDQAVEREYFDSSLKRWISSAIYPTEYTTQYGKKLYFHMVHDIHERKIAEEELKHSVQKLKEVTKSVINLITVTVEKRDPYTAGHQQRVSRLSEEIAKEMKLSEEQINGIRVAGLVHDIGKIGVPIEILSKPGKINSLEYDLIKSHSDIGHEVLKEIDFYWPVAEIVLQHHERINGNGYPGGLKEKNILLEARVIAVADVVEAMASHRPYRQAYGIEFALNEINREKGRLYDPEVVEACLRIFKNGFCL